jgi:peptidyl-prolyl cis-trans isomerase C
MRRLIREPLVHFLLLGALIFFTASFVNNQNRKSEKTIVISNEKVGSILRFYQIQNGSIPSKQQLDAMIEDYIREEIFYREALKMHLDKEDEIVRRRLSQKMEFLQSDLSVVPEPSEKILRAYYTSNPGNFRDSGLVSFTHIYFSADKKGEADAKQRALSVKEDLSRKNVLRNPQMGDPFSLQYDYTGQNKLDIVQLFGNKPILDSLFESPPNQWVGPVESGYGWHLLRISERTKPRVPPFESIEAKVKELYMAEMKNNLNKAAYEKLMKKYFIRRDYLNFNE